MKTKWETSEMRVGMNQMRVIYDRQTYLMPY